MFQSSPGYSVSSGKYFDSRELFAVSAPGMNTNGQVNDAYLRCFKNQKHSFLKLKASTKKTVMLIISSPYLDSLNYVRW